MDFCARLLLIFFLVVVAGCSRSGPDSPSGDKADVDPSPEMSTPSPDLSPPLVDSGRTVHFKKTTIKTRQGQKWELEADQVDWADERSRARALDVLWWLVDDEGIRTVRVESPEADIDMDNEVVTFIGETIATKIGFPESLEVKKLVYRGKERMFYGSEGVTWKRPDVELTGETLTATAELDKVQLKGGVKGKSKGGFDGLAKPRRTD